MIPLPRLLGDVGSLVRGERDLILAVAGPFLFLPALAVQLLTDAPPALPVERTPETVSAWFDTVASWGQANAGWYLLADAIGLYGLAVLAVLFLDPRRLDVGEALRRAGAMFPRFALASILVAIPVGLGMRLLTLPGLFAQGRLAAVLPVLAAGPPIPASRALARSWRMTAPASFPMFGAVVTLFLAQWIAIGPLASFDAWLRLPTHDNPFVLALVDAGMAAVASCYHVAILLLGIVAYRRFASSGT